jgi:hypothetical protein
MRIYFEALCFYVLIYTLIPTFKKNLNEDIFKILFYFFLSASLRHHIKILHVYEVIHTANKIT